jgi:hypothetical protein
MKTVCQAEDKGLREEVFHRGGLMDHVISQGGIGLDAETDPVSPALVQVHSLGKSLAGRFTRHFGQHGRLEIDGVNLPRGPHPVRHLEGEIAGTAADVQHRSAGLDILADDAGRSLSLSSGFLLLSAKLLYA